MTRLRLKEIVLQARATTAYWTERAVLDFTSSLWVNMRRKGLSQAELAARIGKNPAYISRVLNGTPNVTIKTMVEMAQALDMRVQVALSEKEDYQVSQYTLIVNNAGRTFASDPRLNVVSRRLDIAANDVLAFADAAA